MDPLISWHSRPTSARADRGKALRYTANRSKERDGFRTLHTFLLRMFTFSFSQATTTSQRSDDPQQLIGRKIHNRLSPCLATSPSPPLPISASLVVVLLFPWSRRGAAR